MFAFEDSFALISRWSYMIKDTWESFSQDAGAISIIKVLQSPSVEDGLDPYCLLGELCQEWILDPCVFFIYLPAFSIIQHIAAHWKPLSQATASAVKK